MDELELRLGAIETLLIEWLALEPAPKLQALLAAVRSAGEALDDDEATMRNQAAELVEDAIRRFDGFSQGVGRLRT